MTPPESEALVAVVAITLAAATIAETNRGSLNYRVGVLLLTGAALAVLAAVLHLLARLTSWPG
jgi:hypothetical protein